MLAAQEIERGKEERSEAAQVVKNSEFVDLVKSSVNVEVRLNFELFSSLSFFLFFS